MDPQVKTILDYFEQINRIPRCSRDEEKIAAWLIAWAEAHGLETKKDPCGNIVIRVPASKGFESAPTIVLQGHMDMVCEKRPDIQHDFKTDPIRNIISGDWLHADGTSLGADNGIALAMAMAIAVDATARHPKLELLFTVDEETGLNGAILLDPEILEGRILINIDSEDEGVFTVGCAGGIHSEIDLAVATEPLQSYEILAAVSVSGLRGGHSGIDINRGRANANKILARILDCALEEIDLGLVSFNGGTTHNAIARDATAQVALKPGKFETLNQVIHSLEKTFKIEYAGVEDDLKVAATLVADHPAQLKGATNAQTRKITDLLMALPHGVARMSTEAPGLVDTSANLATISFSENGLHILSSQRSAFTSRLDEITRQVASIARLAGALVETNSAYPAWQPDPDSALLKQCRKTYTALFEKAPKVEIIHAGLECAVIGDKYPEMDMISIGPTMQNPHSPDERLLIPSVLKVWRFLSALLASFGD